MLRVDVRALHQGPAETAGVLQPSDSTFEGLGLEFAGPVVVEGRLSQTGDDEFFWKARLTGRLKGSCRRCLRDVVSDLDAEVEVLFSADPDAAEDPAVYPLSAPVTQVDVRPAVREEVALAASVYPLCRQDCAGLCVRCGADLNDGPCGCTAPSS
ncbi:MAG: DUF177 domain-containing protein [Gemmatimonadota bacterium]|nr:DUF177 domain-containing protein [Gemmatimonadota bacterium]